MTTYTITQEQRQQLQEKCKDLFMMVMPDGYREELRQILESLESLQPNTQETQAQRIEELEAKLRIAQMSTVEKCAEIYMLRQKQQAKPLTADEVWQITASHNFEIHGDRARYIVAMTELAHNIGVKP